MHTQLDDYHTAMKKDKAAKRARNKHEEKYGIESANDVFDPQEQQDANYLYGSQVNVFSLYMCSLSICVFSLSLPTTKRKLAVWLPGLSGRKIRKR